MPAQGFDVLDLEAAGFHHLHGVADVIELGARENVLQDHPSARADLAEVPDVALGAARDAVIEEDAAPGKQLMHLVEISSIVGDADVLVHADAGDFVVTALERHVIGERHRHAVLQPQAGDLGLRIVVLRLRQGDAVRGHAVALRGVAQQRAPAAADVEQRFARPQPQLAAYQLELVPLRLLQRIRPVAKVCAGIDHLGIEEQRIELVARVVMELDEVLVLVFAAPPGGITALELVADLDRSVARQQQG